MSTGQTVAQRVAQPLVLQQILPDGTRDRLLVARLSPSGPRPSRSATWTTRPSMTRLTNTARALLCGRREAQARSRAAVSSARSSCNEPSGAPSKRTVMVLDGTVCRCSTAFAITVVIAARPFTLATRGSSEPRALTPGEQVRDRRQHHRVLAQRRQHLADVPQERRVRADDQHTALLQLGAMVVEQVRRPVQRHRCLPGARTALDHHDAGLIGADDPVLLGLDGRDDVGHPAGAGRLDGGQQRGLTRRSDRRVRRCGRHLRVGEVRDIRH